MKSVGWLVFFFLGDYNDIFHYTSDDYMFGTWLFGFLWIDFFFF